MRRARGTEKRSVKVAAEIKVDSVQGSADVQDVDLCNDVRSNLRALNALLTRRISKARTAELSGGRVRTMGAAVVAGALCAGAEEEGGAETSGAGAGGSMSRCTRCTPPRRMRSHEIERRQTKLSEISQKHSSSKRTKGRFTSHGSRWGALEATVDQDDPPPHRVHLSARATPSCAQSA